MIEEQDKVYGPGSIWGTTPAPARDEDVVRVQARVVGLLNEVEALLTGWRIGYDRETVEKLTGPLYELCDTDDVPAKRRAS